MKALIVPVKFADGYVIFRTSFVDSIGVGSQESFAEQLKKLIMVNVIKSFFMIELFK